MEGARALGDVEVAGICEGSMYKEREMAEWIDAQPPDSARRHVR
ncbi:hypothetical protein [Caenispirillum salinarum]